MFGSIATWIMARDGLEIAYDILSNKGSASLATIELIKDVENRENFHSVGYGGLPNRYGVVELDSAFMNGDDFSYGAVAGLKSIKNPILLAYDLSKKEVNNFLVGDYALDYALKNGYEKVNLLTSKSSNLYKKKLEESQNKDIKLKAYDGHDTVGAISLDTSGSMVAATSTSGLFFKEGGRVGDSPLLGSGLYADSKIGACVATGVGEDITKALISYRVVSYLEAGLSPSKATKKALLDFKGKYPKDLRDISVVAMDNRGNWGAYSNIKTFSFVVATDKESPKAYLLDFDENNDQIYKEATSDDIKDFLIREGALE